MRKVVSSTVACVKHIFQWLPKKNLHSSNKKKDGNVNLKHDSKPFEGGSGMDVIGFKSGNVTANEKQNDDSYNSEGRESEAYILSDSMEAEYNWNTGPKYDEIDEMVKDLTATVQCIRKTESFEDNGVLHMVKSLAQCKLPKVVVCIDERALSRDNYLVDSRVSKKRLCSASVFPANDIKNETRNEEFFDIDVPAAADVLKPSAYRRKQVCFANQDPLTNSKGKDIKDYSCLDCNSKNSILALEKLEDKPCKKGSTLRELLSMPQLDTFDIEFCNSKPYKTSSQGADQKTLQRQRETDFATEVALADKNFKIVNEQKLSISPVQNDVVELHYDLEKTISEFFFQDDSATKEYGPAPDEVFESTPIFTANYSNDGFEETTLVKFNNNEGKKLADRPLDSSTFEESSSTIASKSTHSVELDSDFITFHLDSYTPPNANDTSDTAPVLPLSNGEWSLFAASPSRLIARSVSFRSDSNSSSKDSFAFPLLEPVWDGSPIKMPKADQIYPSSISFYSLPKAGQRRPSSISLYSPPKTDWRRPGQSSCSIHKLHKSDQILPSKHRWWTKAFLGYMHA